MTTKEAFKVSATVAADLHRFSADHATHAAQYKGKRHCRSLYAAAREYGALNSERAEALDLLRVDHQMLRDQLQSITGTCDFVLNDTLAGYELSKEDIRQARAKLRAAKKVLKATQP